MRYYRLQGRKMQMMLMTLALVEEEPETEPEEEAEDDIIVSEAITPFRIDKKNNVYTIDVYAIAVDENGSYINSVKTVTLADITVNSTAKITLFFQFPWLWSKKDPPRRHSYSLAENSNYCMKKRFTSP